MDAGQTGVVKRATGTALQVNGVVVDPLGASNGQVLTVMPSGVIQAAGLSQSMQSSIQQWQRRTATAAPIAVSAASDFVVGVNVAAAASVTLPTGALGQAFVIEDESGAAATNNITISPAGGGTIDGAATKVISTNYDSVVLVCVGTNAWRTVANVGAAGGTSTLPAAYAAGAAGPQVLALDSIRLGVIARDAAASIGQTLLGAQNNAGTVKFLDITPTGPQQILSGMADGAAAVALAVDTSTAWSLGKQLSLRSGGTERFYASYDGSAYVTLASAGGFLKVFNSSNSGIIAYNATLFLNANNTSYAQLDSTGLYSTVGTLPLGTSGNPWYQVNAKQFAGVQQAPALAASMTLDPTAGETVLVNLGATALTAVTISAGKPSQQLTVELIQDAAGGKTYPLTWTNVAFAGGTAVAGASTANYRDVYTFRYDTTLAKWVEISRSLAVR